jgi:hypothetical protein
MATEPTIKRPRVPLPHPDVEAQPWYPYPLLDVPVPSLVQETLVANAKLADIIRDVIKAIRSPPDLQRALKLYKQLLHWKDNLPDCLALPNSRLPHVLLMQ